MRSRLVTTSALLACLAAPLSAQQRDASVAQAMAASATKYVAPACSADKNLHFKTGSGRTYLKSAIEASDPEKQKSLLGQGERVILEAIKDNGQEKSGGAWYFLGRIRLHEGDVAGADSAFARALQLAPDCATEIDGLRRPIFAALFNPGLDAYKAGNVDSAIVLFRQAARVNSNSIQPPFLIGAALYNKKQYDTAAVYFKTALATPAVPEDAKMRSQAKFSYGLTLLALNQPKEALPLLRDYAKEAPEDPNAKRALANAYSAAGQTDSATALQKEILASGDVSSGTGGTDGGASANDALTIGHSLYREKKYADAAAAFEKVLATEPNNRDALYWAGYSYVGTADGAKLLDAGKRLLALEPYNEEARKMMGHGYELTKNEAARTATATELRATPLKIEVKSWTTKADGASLGLAATGRQGITKTGKMITATPITLTFEMLDAKGGVVATKDVQLPAISPGQSQDLTVDVTGQGIVGFRYKKKA